MDQFLDFTLVKIRLKQINYQSGGLGAFYIILLTAVFIFLEYFIYRTYQDLTNSIWLLAILWFSLLSVHLSRRDARFVHTQLNNADKKIFTEYLIFTLPFTLPAFGTMQFWSFFVHLLFLRLLSIWKYIPKEKSVYWPKLGRLIAPSDFEWLAGIRTHWIGFLFFYSLSWIFCWLRVFPIFSLWFLLLIISTFFNESEPINFFRIQYKGSPAQFLKWKIKRSGLLMSIFFVPQLFINAVFHPDIYYAHIVFYLMSWIILLYLIYSKYTVYNPNERTMANSVLQAMVLMAAVIPFLAPLPLILMIRAYRTAHLHLKTFN